MNLRAKQIQFLVDLLDYTINMNENKFSGLANFDIRFIIESVLSVNKDEYNPIDSNFLATIERSVIARAREERSYFAMMYQPFEYDTRKVIRYVILNKIKEELFKL